MILSPTADIIQPKPGDQFYGFEWVRRKVSDLITADSLPEDTFAAEQSDSQLSTHSRAGVAKSSPPASDTVPAPSPPSPSSLKKKSLNFLKRIGSMGRTPSTGSMQGK